MGDVLGYLIVVALLVGAWFAIRHLATAEPGEPPTISAKTAKWLTWGVYALAAVLLLSALGVCGTVTDRTGLDPLLNR